MPTIVAFEQAIIDFGVDAALEYFATPQELHHLWDEMKEREKQDCTPAEATPTTEGDT